MLQYIFHPNSNTCNFKQKGNLKPQSENSLIALYNRKIHGVFNRNIFDSESHCDVACIENEETRLISHGISLNSLFFRKTALEVFIDVVETIDIIIDGCGIFSRVFGEIKTRMDIDSNEMMCVTLSYHKSLQIIKKRPNRMLNEHENRHTFNLCCHKKPERLLNYTASCDTPFVITKIHNGYKLKTNRPFVFIEIVIELPKCAYLISLDNLDLKMDDGRVVWRKRDVDINEYVIEMAMVTLEKGGDFYVRDVNFMMNESFSGLKVVKSSFDNTYVKYVTKNGRVNIRE